MPDQVLLDIMIESLRLEPVNGGSRSWAAPLLSYFKECGICVLQHDQLIQEFEESREAFRQYMKSANDLGLNYKIEARMTSDVDRVLRPTFSLILTSAVNMYPIMSYIFMCGTHDRPLREYRIDKVKRPEEDWEDYDA